MSVGRQVGTRREEVPLLLLFGKTRALCPLILHNSHDEASLIPSVYLRPMRPRSQKCPRVSMLTSCCSILTSTLKIYILGQNKDWVTKYKFTSRTTQRKCLKRTPTIQRVLTPCYVPSILPDICIYIVKLNSEGSVVSCLNANNNVNNAKNFTFRKNP